LTVRNLLELIRVYPTALHITSRALCCAGILCSVSPNCCWVKLIQLMLYSVARCYSSSPECSWLAICRWAYIQQPA